MTKLHFLHRPAPPPSPQFIFWTSLPSPPLSPDLPVPLRPTSRSGRVGVAGPSSTSTTWLPQATVSPGKPIRPSSVSIIFKLYANSATFLLQCRLGHFHNGLVGFFFCPSVYSVRSHPSGFESSWLVPGIYDRIPFLLSQGDTGVQTRLASAYHFQGFVLWPLRHSAYTSIWSDNLMVHSSRVFRGTLNRERQGG